MLEMSSSNRLSKKSTIKIFYEGSVINFIPQIFPFYLELFEHNIPYFFLNLNTPKDHISLKVNHQDQELLNKLVEKYKTKLDFGAIEPFQYDADRFGNENSISAFDESLMEVHKIILKFFSYKLDDLDYGNFLTDAVFIFNYFVSMVFKEEKLAEDFHNMYYEQWKKYLPKDIDQAVIIKSWQEEIAILQSFVDFAKMNDQKGDQLNKFQEIGKIAFQFNAKLEEIGAAGLLEERTNKFEYQLKIQDGYHRTKSELLADLLHYVLNAYGIKNEDEALVCLLSDAIKT